MKTSVIICAYTMGRWEELVAAVESCRDQSVVPDEIVVVIDYNEELEERARRDIRDVVVVSNELSKGLSGARNTGVLESRGDTLVFLDDDAYGEHQWLEKLTLPFEDDSVVGTGGWIVPHWQESEPAWFPGTFLWVLGCSYDGLPADGSQIRNPIGASMAMRRRVFDEVGGYTSGIGRVGTTPLGCEETELCIRYSHRHPDDKFILVRDAVVHHRVPSSRATAKYFISRCWAEGLSKAAVSSLVGSESGLSSEREHVLKAIPREVFSSIFMIPVRPMTSLRRLSLIVVGSTTAALGWFRGSLAMRRHPLVVAPVHLHGGAVPENARKGDYGSEVGFGELSSDEGGLSVTSGSWRPLPMVQIDVDSPLRDTFVPGGPHEVAWVEAVKHGQVIGRTELTLVEDKLPAEELQGFVETLDDFVPSDQDVPEERLPSATVVVPTICQVPSQLVQMVTQLLDLDYPEFDIVVVDNRTNPTQPLPDLPGGDRLQVVCESVPGISAARNRGVMVATGEMIAFTDDDVIVDRGWLRAMGRRFVLNPEVDAIGGLVLPSEISTQPQLWFEEFFGGFCQSFELNVVSSDDQRNDPLYPYAPGRFGAGCNMAFRRGTLEEFGGFRLSLGTGTPSRGGEDLEIFITMALAGKTLAFEPAALVRHTHRQTEEEFLKQVFGYGAGLTAMYMSLIVAQPSHLLAMLRRAPRGWVSFRRSREERAASRFISYPRDTSWIERKGMVYGPYAFLKSYRRYRKLGPDSVPVLQGKRRY